VSGTTPLPAIPNGGAGSAEQARLAGRQLAEHRLLAARHDHERPEVADVLADARPLLSTYGIGFEILRTRPGMVVLRARTDGRATPQVACELVKGLLGAVTDQVCGVKASVVENTCAQRGAPACLYSMVWEGTAARQPLPPPPPETLFDPPLETAPASWSSPSSPASSRSPETARDAGTPTDVDEPALLQWDGPSSPEAAPGPGVDTPATPQQATEPPQRQTATTQQGHDHILPASAPSSAYQFQPSAPNSIIRPTPMSEPPAPGLPLQSPVAPVAAALRPQRNLGKVLNRRAWLLALALVAGSAGGWFAGVHAGTSYGAQATLLVQSGAGKTGPGGANDALALATTYSAVIPKDQAILGASGGSLAMTPSAVSKALSVTVQTGTSLLLLNFTASTPNQAVRGATAVARAVASSTRLTAAIAPGSVAIVSVPTSAHRQGTLHKYGIVLGAFLGLVVGIILVLAAERADPRIDDAASMASATGSRAALVPNDLSLAELARVLSDIGRTNGGLTIVPINVTDTAPTMELARGLRSSWPANGPAVAISPSFSSGVVELSRGSGPTVLISHPGARQRDVVAASERLRMIGRPPVWAVLAHRRLRSRVSGRVG